MAQNKNHLLLIDGSGYIFRAYHALPPLTRKQDGLPIGAVSGFCNMLWKLLAEARNTKIGVTATHLAVIFDYSAKTFRNEIYPEYKANRSETPEDLIPQFSLIRHATRAFNLVAVEKPGYEADDIIATYVKQAEAQDFLTTIISSDKDLMQLVSDKTRMYDGMKDRHIGIEEVVEKWGVPPQKMIDLQAMAGDSVDNIPGIPGIGPKTAAMLLEQFGSLDNLLAAAGTIKQQKRRESILAYKEQALLSRRLVQLCDDVPLELSLDALFLEALDATKLIGFLKAMELGTLTRRVATATDCDAGAVDPAFVEVDWSQPESEIEEVERAPDLFSARFEQNSPSTKTHFMPLYPKDLVKKRQQDAQEIKIDRNLYQTISDEQDLADWLKEASSQGFMAFDVETTSLDAMQAELVGFSIALQPNKAAYIPLAHRSGGDDLLGARASGQMDFATALALIKPILESTAILKIGQNIKYDWQVCQRYGIEIRGFDDTMLLSYVCDSGRGLHGLDALAMRHLSHKMIAFKEIVGGGKSALSFADVPIEKAQEYAAEDADITLRLWQLLKPRLAVQAQARVYYRLELPLVPVLCRMESRGILVDRSILAQLSGEFALQMTHLEQQIYAQAGEVFNIGSPQQLGRILFEKMGLPGGVKTKTGQWSTAAQALEELAADGHELPRKIVDWRQLAKLKSTYTDALPNFINPQTGRVHTSYSMAATTTGRLASSDPNLQNIPVRTSEGRRIRSAFIASPGHQLLSADYSQIELRLLAHIADIASLKLAFASGLDIHAMTASEMFGVPIDKMDAETRRRAKAINFGIIYGISAFGLAAQLGIGREEASLYIKTYFERFPGIRDYMEATKTFARTHGYVETIFGRRIHYPEILSPKPQIRAFNERAAINAPIQGAAADIIRRSMVRMDQALLDAGLGAKMLLQVHDELIFEVPDDQIEATKKLVVQIMENACLPALNLSIALKVDASAATNWNEAH